MVRPRALGLVIVLQSGCNIAAGDTVKIGLTVDDPTANFNFTVSSTVNGTAVNSNTVTINAIPPVLSAASVTVGYTTVYTISGLGTAPTDPWSVANLTDVPPANTTAYPITSMVLTASGIAGPAGSIGWYNGTNGAGYSVTYTPSGGTLTTDPVSSAVIGAASNIVTVNLANGIPAGSTVNVTAEGLSPLHPVGAITVQVAPQYTAPPVPPATASTPNTATPAGATETSSGLTFGTSVTGLTVTPSPALASTASTYAVSFKATTGVPAGDFICLGEPSSTFASTDGVLVTDTTTGSQYVAPLANVIAESFTGTCGTLPAVASTHNLAIQAVNTINAGDQVTVTVTNVGNPSTVATYSDFAVSDEIDTVSVNAPAYQIGVSSSVGVTVAVSPTTPGALATYTVSGAHASAAIIGGSEITLSVVTPTPPTGTVLPDSGADYTLTDSTTTTGSGGLTLVTYNSHDSVTLAVPNAINSGDMLTFTIDDVINPPLAGNYAMGIINGNIAGPAVTAPIFPDGNVTNPDGGIVNYSGTDYLFAGQHAFGIPTPAVLSGVQVADKATVLTAPTGATVPNTVPAVGTVVVVYNSPTIYAVGTDGQLHGFATPAQFLGDGFDPADVITVPNITGLTVGATAGSVGTALTALATSANGAIVDSSGTYYVFAGGKAFGIPTPASLAAVQAGDTATVLSGTITSTNTGATPRPGTVVTLNSAVWVASGVALYGFKSMAQLQADGYGGTPSIVVPNVGGLSPVSNYTGS